MVGNKGLVQIKPKEGCKLVGTVRGTKAMGWRLRRVRDEGLDNHDRIACLA
jgi:hypothetical protein